jgi:glutamate carboxypeptidase
VGLSQAILAAAALTRYDEAVTVNVGAVGGGTVVNRVPHEATAALEMRAFDPEVFRRTEAEILALESAVPRTRLIVTKRGETPSWPESEATLTALRFWQEAGEALGGRVVAEHRGGLSDANYLWPLGPTLDGLGPAGGCAHCSERSADGAKVPEFVAVDSFVPKTVLNLVALTRWWQGKGADMAGGGAEHSGGAGD